MTELDILKFSKPIADGEGEYFTTANKLKDLYYSLLELLDEEKFLLVPRGVKAANQLEYYGNTYEVAFIPDSLVTAAEGVFTNCPKLKFIEIDPDNEYFETIDGNLYSKNNVLLQYAIDKSDISFTIPSGINRIGDSACKASTNLTTVVVPKSVESIGNNAFNSCEKLTTIYYCGSKAEWETISIGTGNNKLNINTICYYSETKPEDENAEHYWHYVGNIPTKWERGVEFIWTTEGDGTYDTASNATCYALISQNGKEIKINPIRYSTTGDKEFSSASCIEKVTVTRIATFSENEYFAATTSSKSYIVNGEKHSMNSGVTTADPTCTDPGEIIYTCLNGCGHSYPEDIPANGHTQGAPEYEEMVNDDDNHKKVIRCTVCTSVISSETEEHSYDEGSPNYDNNTLTKTCVKCGHIFIETLCNHETETYYDSNEAGHVLVEKCVDCGAEQSRGDIESHTPETQYSNNGDGTHHVTEKCTVCGYTVSETNEDHAGYFEGEIPYCEHCDAEGYEDFPNGVYCSNHEWYYLDGEPDQWCVPRTDVPEAEQKCKNCDATQMGIIPGDGVSHNLSDWEHYEEYSVRKCTNDGCDYTQTCTHENITTDYFEEDEGHLVKETCTNCGKVVKETSSVKHSFEKIGEGEYQCVCGAVHDTHEYTYENGIGKCECGETIDCNHIWGDWDYSIDTRECSNCGATETCTHSESELDSDNKYLICHNCGKQLECSHDITVWGQTEVIDKQPTCTEAGSKHYVCGNCEANLSDTEETIPATGHNLSNWDTSGEYSVRSCTNGCGYTETCDHEGTTDTKYEEVSDADEWEEVTYCTNCNHVLRSVPHEHTVEVLDEGSGSYIIKCSVCNTTGLECPHPDEHVNPDKIDDGDCQTNSTIQYTCSVCGGTWEEEGDLGDHVWDSSTGECIHGDAICDHPEEDLNEDLTQRICAQCGYVLGDVEPIMECECGYPMEYYEDYLESGVGAWVCTNPECGNEITDEPEEDEPESCCNEPSYTGQTDYCSTCDDAVEYCDNCGTLSCGHGTAW